MPKGLPKSEVPPGKKKGYCDRYITGAYCVEGDCKFHHAYPPGLKAVEKRAYKLAAGLREDARAAPSVASTLNRGAARSSTPARAASPTAASPAVAIPQSVGLIVSSDVVCKGNQIPSLPQLLSFLSPTRQPLPRVVVKHVTFDVRTHRILHPLVVIGGRQSSLSKFSRYGLV